MWKKIFVLLIIMSFSAFLIINLINNFNSNFELYHENHNVQKGESTLYHYYDENHCFSSEEIEMISNRFQLLDIFDNKIFKVSNCGDIRISFDVKDYDAWGYIYLYSTSSFEELKKNFENNYREEVKIYDNWISIMDSQGEINIYRNKDNFSFRIIYQTTLPYKYKVDEINTYPTFVKYFLKLNQKNIESGKSQ